jgi:hypothetical protein
MSQPRLNSNPTHPNDDNDLLNLVEIVFIWPVYETRYKIGVKTMVETQVLMNDNLSDNVSLELVLCRMGIFW